MSCTARRSSAPSHGIAPGGALVLTAIRSRPGSRAAAPTKPPSGTPSSSIVASRNSAASTTRRASGPLTDRPCHASSCGATGTRSRVGLSPKRPFHVDGVRIEPAPSEPSATPASPAAIAAPLPPLDPPGVRLRSHGLRAEPKVVVSVAGSIVISGTQRLADDDRPGRAQPADDLGVARHRARVGGGAPRGRLAGDVDVVLDRDRHAEQGASVCRRLRRPSAWSASASARSASTTR